MHPLGDGSLFDVQAVANKANGKTYLKPDDGKCLHYYFYFIKEELGLCYVRVATWLPCRLQVYCNGHNWLAQGEIDFSDEVPMGYGGACDQRERGFGDLEAGDFVVEDCLEEGPGALEEPVGRRQELDQ